MLAVAMKGFAEFFDWAKERLFKIFNKEQQAENVAETY
jgi:hypothetical protein